MTYSDLVSGHCPVNPFSDNHRYKAVGGTVNTNTGHVTVERRCKYCAHTTTTEHPPK
jgi:hypothetical protein